MKKYILPLLSFLFIFINNSSFSNTAPVKPTLYYPMNQDTNYVLEYMYFAWFETTDSDATDTISYDIYLGTDSSSLNLYIENINDNLTTDNFDIYYQSGYVIVFLSGYLKRNTTYYWKVVAKDGKGGVSESDRWWFKIGDINYYAPEEPVSPIPINNRVDVDKKPVLSWHKCLDADGDTVSYKIYLDTKSSPNNLIVSELTDTTYRISSELSGNTKYYWKVIADDGDGKETSGEIWNFTTCNTPPPSPQLTFPANGATDIAYNLQLSWQSSIDSDGDAVTYEFWYGNTIIPDKKIVVSDQYVSLSLQADTTYYWKVIAIDAKGGQSSSAIWHFKTTGTTGNTSPGTPQIIYPVDNATEIPLEVSLQWAAPLDTENDALEYSLCFGANPDSLLQTANALTDTSYVVILDPGVTYYWQIVACDGKGGTSQSPVQSFTATSEDVTFSNLRVYLRNVGTQTYLYQQTTLSPNFDYTTQDYSVEGNSLIKGAIALVLNYDTTNTSINMDLPQGFTSSDTIIYDAGLPSDATRIIKVEGDFSSEPGISFRVIKGNAIRLYNLNIEIDQAPTNIKLLVPAKGEENVDIHPTFSWDGGDDPEGGSVFYRIYTGTSSDNLSVFTYAFNTKTFHSEIMKLKRSQRYYWQICATDEDGQSTYSNISWFVIGIGDKDTALTQLYPREISTYVEPETELVWELNADIPVTYDLYFGTTNPPVLMASNLTDTKYALTELSPATQYYWNVVATDATGNTWSGTVREFITKPQDGNETGTFTDIRDGQIYQWVEIEGVKWMAHNLAYNPVEEDGYYNYQYWYDTWDSDKKNYSMYNHDENNISKYGYLYDWRAALNYEEITDTSEYIQGLCPCGWRMATHSDWVTSFYPLVNENTLHYSSWDLETYSNSWLNKSGLSVLPSSYRNGYNSGAFQLYKSSQFWLAQKNFETPKLVGYLYNNGLMNSYSNTKNGAASIRCVKINPNNHVPLLPKLIGPSDNQANVVYPVNFEWHKAMDEDGDSLTYDLYIDTVADPIQRVALGLKDTTYSTDALTANTTYYWKIRVRDAYDEVAESEIWSFTTENITGNTGPDVPVLLQPATGAQGISKNPTVFSWQTSADTDGDAITYNLYIGYYEGYQKLVAQDITITSYEVNNLEAGKTYYWKVMAKDGRGGISESDASGFSIINQAPSTPQLLTPSIGTIGTPIYHTMTWSKSTDPDGDNVFYQLYIGDTDSTFNIWYTGSSTQYNFGGNAVPNNKTYYWKVIATDNKGGRSVSETWSFTTYSYTMASAPSLVSPADDKTEVDLNPVLKWNKINNSVSYNYHVYINGIFVADVYDSDSYTFTTLPGGANLNPHTKYEWQIIATYGSMIGFSEEWSFTTKNADPDTVLLVSPLNNATDISYNPTLTWFKTEDADNTLLKYQLYLDTSSDPQTVVVSSQDTAYTASNLLPNVTYYWKVKALEDNGGSSTSEIRSFTIQNNTVNTPPTKPVLVSPLNYDAQQTTPVTLTWNPSWDIDGDAISYNVYFENQQAPEQLIANHTSDTSITITSMLTNMDYYWKVVAIDTQNDSTESSIWHFKLANTAPEAPVLVSPADGIKLSTSSDMLLWTASADIDNDVVTYDVYLGTSSTPTTRVAQGLSTLSYITGMLDNNVTYYWKVVACDPHGGSMSSPVYSFSGKNEPPELPMLIYPVSGDVVTGSVVTLQWHAGVDIDNSNLVYDLFVGSSASSLQKVSTLYSDTTFSLGVSNSGTTYFWKIVVRDAYDETAESTVESFTYQQSGVNQPPSIPVLLSPVDKSTEVETSVSLEWNQSIDPEGETVTFELYVNETLISSGISDTTYKISHLGYAKTYTWKISAKDEKNNLSESSSVWKFTTSSLTDTTFEISGTVTDMSGVGMQGVGLEGFPETVTTDTDGNYSAHVPAGWNGIFYPLETDYSFQPQQIILNNVQSGVINQNFVGLYAGDIILSGKINNEQGNPLINVSLTGTGSTVETDANGEYSVAVPVGWSGTITPALDDYSFVPASYTINSLQEDSPDLDFVATYTGSYSISGTITDASMNPLKEVLLTGFSEEIKTDSTGYYEGDVIAGWSGTITPVKQGYQFNPGEIIYTDIDGDKTNQNFQGANPNSITKNELSEFRIFPNPTSSGVQIIIENLEYSQNISIEIITTQSQLVKKFKLKPGTNKIYWEGDNETGNPVSSGIYFCRIISENKIMASSKIIVIR